MFLVKLWTYEGETKFLKKQNTIYSFHKQQVIAPSCSSELSEGIITLSNEDSSDPSLSVSHDVFSQTGAQKNSTDEQKQQHFETLLAVSSIENISDMPSEQ